MSTWTSTAFQTLRQAAVVTALLLAGTLASGAPARADLPSPLELRRAIHDHVHDVVRDAVRVPRQIHRSHMRALRSHFSGRVYFAPHRHHHAIYRFPVRVHGHVVHRHYAYCNGHLFGRVRGRHR